MLFQEVNLKEGAEVWARTMHLSPDECVDVISQKKTQNILPPPQRRNYDDSIAKNYKKHEEEVIRYETKMNKMLNKFELISKRTCEKVQKDERVSKFFVEPVQKVIQQTFTPQVKDDLRTMIKRANKYVETQKSHY